MFRRALKSSALSLVIAAGLFSIMSLGGCPVAQTPQTPDTTGNQQQTTPADTTTPDDTLERPITPPNLNGGSDTNQTGQTQPDTGGDTGGGTQNPSDNSVIMISIGQPSDDIAVAAPPRASSTITLDFTLVDYAGKVTSGELLLARDNNGDGLPDGAPIYNAQLGIHNGSNTWLFDTSKVAQYNLLQGQGFGKFIIGVKASTSAGAETIAYSSATISIDDTAPTVAWQGAGETALIANMEDRLINRGTPWTIKLQTEDTSAHSWRIFLDPDQTPFSGNEYELFPETKVNAGSAVRTPATPASLSAFPAGTYYYYYVVSDGIAPATAGYAPGMAPGSKARLAITRRLISTADNPFNIAEVAERQVGATLQGFNFNDLAGSSMAGVPDVDGDGYDELAIVSRFGKPRLEQVNGVGWGEAYLVLGQATRLTDSTRLNAVGSLTDQGIPGLIFTGIRCPVTTSWTEGISDVTTIDDMDSDGMPEIVFSFPRVESISLANPESVWQANDMGAHHEWMGDFEYDPWLDEVDTLDITDPTAPGFPFNRSSLEVEVNGHTWLKNRTQFTRGGVVIVSSTTSMLQNRFDLNRKGDRIIDLHETGQVFNGMSREDDHSPFIEDFSTTLPDAAVTMCDDSETEYEIADAYWDILQTNVGPFGFDNWVTNRKFMDSMNPPIANMWRPTVLMPDINRDYLRPINSPCNENLVLSNHWLPYTPCNGNGNDTGTASLYFPIGDDPNSSYNGFYIHTGFAGSGSDPETSPWPENVGARLLGQRVNDRFGSAISSDGTWLYMSAPTRSATSEDVPALCPEGVTDAVVRDESGVIYQFRTYSPWYIGGPTRSQLWIENGNRTILDPNNPDLNPDDPNDTNDPNNYIDVRAAWPHPDIQRPDHEDYNMPLPHTYIIEDLGYDRRYDLFWYNELVNLRQPVPTEEDLFEATLRSITYNLTLGMVDGTAATGRLRPPGTVEIGLPTDACETTQWPSVTGVGTAHWYVSHTSQIVGPHPGAKLAFVRSVGDIDGDGVEDFAVGSENIKSNLLNPDDPSAVEVGGIFIVFGRAPGLEGDYLLEQLALPPNNLNRLAGVVFKGATPNEKLARTFDKAGNFDGQAGEDVLVGNEGGGNGNGAAIVLLGSPILSSPANGWTTTDAVNEGVAIRFVGENFGDRAGANVTSAGDVDGDGLGDILIAAPGHDNNRGAVYLIYGSTTFVGGESISLAEIGTVDLPGIKFVGKNVGDELGGGVLTYGDHDGANPYGEVSLNPNDEPVKVYSDGIVSIGDLDGDGRDDFAISSMLADPNLRQDGGEVYVIYGAGD